MAYCHCYQIAITLAILVLVSLSSPSGAADRLSADLHKTYNKCTDAYIFSIVRNVVTGAINKEKRMGASLLRLHFHDCFVKGCDGSVLLDDTDSFTGEKNAGPNRNSARGFDVVDEIKSAVEEACPGKVSCADILAIAARDSVVLLGGPYWEVITGRRDAKTASRDAANQGIPGPNSNLTALINRFDALGLNTTDLVALSGAHTIGLARCTNFRARIYNESNMDQTYAKSLRKNCSSVSGQGDNNTAPLDHRTPHTFDNMYYVNLVNQEGLLHSDQVLYNGSGGSTDSFVKSYKNQEVRFLNDFAVAMVKMGNIGLLKGTKGEIRKDCRRVNGK